MSSGLKKITSSVFSKVGEIIANESKNHSDLSKLNDAVDSFLADEKLDTHIRFYLTPDEGLLLTLENLEVKMDHGATIFDNREFNTWLREVKKQKITLSNCKFTHPDLNLVTLQIIMSSPHNSQVVYDSCELGNALIKSTGCQNLIIKDCIKGICEISKSPDYRNITIDNCEIIQKFEISSGVERLKISNSKILTLDIDDLITKNTLKLLQFDTLSRVINNDFEIYKQLRTIASQSKLRDKIQEHILYSNEMRAYANLESTDKDSEHLFRLNYFANRNGLEFKRPIIIMVITSFIFVFLIFLAEYCNSKTSIGVSYLWQTFNLIPTTSILEEDFTYASKAFDALRRIAIVVFTFLTVSSALRFKLKI